jgi:hypothetical protein
MELLRVRRHRLLDGGKPFLNRAILRKQGNALLIAITAIIIDRAVVRFAGRARLAFMSNP